MALRAALLPVLWAAVQAENDALQHKESFPKDFPTAHIVLVALPLSLFGIAIIAVGVRSFIRTVRLTVVLVLGVWFALVAVGILSWAVSYAVSRGVILERAEHSITQTAGYAASLVSGEFTLGVTTMQMLQMMGVAGQLTINESWPAPDIIFDRAMSTVLKKSSVFLLYYGTRDGILHGLRKDAAENLTVHYVTAREGDYLPEWVACDAHDFGSNCNVTARPAACANHSSEAASQCRASCGFPSSGENCAGHLVEFTSTTTDTVHAETAIFRAPEKLVVHAHPGYDPRQRPWFTRSVGPVWSAPYMFPTGDTGITGSGAVYYRDTFLGTVAADFTLGSMNEFMAGVKPSENGVAFLMTRDELLIGSSMTPQELAADTGVVATNSYIVIEMKKYPHTEEESKIVLAVGAVKAKWGSLTLAVGSTMYQHRGYVVVSYPVDIQGLPLLLVLSMPFSDVMGEADTASTLSLAIVVAVSVSIGLLVAGGTMLALHPLGALRRDMCDVACMQLESHESLASSSLTEIRSMQESFLTMVGQLREYKTFIPAAVFQHHGSLSDEVPAPGLGDRHAAIVFTDIIGSTRLWEMCPDDMRIGLNMHNSLIRGSLRNLGGYEVKTIGDSFMVAFATLEDGVRFGVDVQKGLAQVVWPDALAEAGGIQVRIGVQFGEVAPEHNEVVNRYDYFGPTVNRAARLEACGVAGAVVVQSRCVGEVAGMGMELDVVPLGARLLRGIEEMIEVHALTPPGVNVRFLETSGNPLQPRQSTSQSSTGSDSSVMSAGRSHFDTLKVKQATVCMAGAVPSTADNDQLTPAAERPLVVSLTGLVASCERTNGTMIAVVGDVVVAGWNVMVRCGDHTDQAFRFIGMASARQHLRCGMAAGKVLAGYVRAAGQRFISAAGDPMSVCMMLHARALTGPSMLFATGDMATEYALDASDVLKAAGRMEREGRPTLHIYELLRDEVQEWCSDKQARVYTRATRNPRKDGVMSCPVHAVFADVDQLSGSDLSPL